MRDELLRYYERELTYIRQMAARFSEQYPKVASRLVLEPDKCEDPHVERLLEAFAFLAARVHLKIDDEFPEITEALLSIVYPQLVRPVPSMSIVEFQLDVEQGKLSTGLKIDRESVLYSRPVEGVACKFRTCYDTTLWPVSVAAAEWTTPDQLKPPLGSSDSVAAIRLELRCAPDAHLPQLQISRLRFYLDGESHLVNKLYELLSCKLNGIVLRDPAPRSRVAPVNLPASCLQPAGFGEEEGMLPYSKRSFVSYRLLQEFFTFPEKFLFFDLENLEPVWPGGFRDRVEIIFLLAGFDGEQHREMLQVGVSRRTFRLGCTPIVNLFPQAAEPILLDQQKYEYPIIPDIRRPKATEIFSVDEVLCINVETQETIPYEPFYSFRQDARAKKEQAFWIAHRRPSRRLNDKGTDIALSLLDLSQRPLYPEADTLMVRTTCSNRDLPGRLPFGSEAGDFEFEGGMPIARIMTLKKPTLPLRTALGKEIQWRLVSHLSLNYLSLVEEGREALQQILKLYNIADSPHSNKMIDGITRVESNRHFARVVSENGISFTRGARVEIEFDEEQYVGGGVYLFAAVLERFLGLYTSLNSFSQLVATLKQRKEVLREWPPRAGRKILM